MDEESFQAGFAAGLAYKKATRKKQPNPYHEEMDKMLSELLSGRGVVTTSEASELIGLDISHGNQVSVGHALKRLGWIRYRESTGAKRWLYRAPVS
jgi:hypothetical protein